MNSFAHLDLERRAPAEYKTSTAIAGWSYSIVGCGLDDLNHRDLAPVNYHMSPKTKIKITPPRADEIKIFAPLLLTALFATATIACPPLSKRGDREKEDRYSDHQIDNDSRDIAVSRAGDCYEGYIIEFCRDGQQCSQPWKGLCRQKGCYANGWECVR